MTRMRNYIGRCMGFGGGIDKSVLLVLHFPLMNELPKIKVKSETRRKLRLLAALLDKTMIEAADIAITEKLTEVQGKK
jgi:hypothetical protein